MRQGESVGSKGDPASGIPWVRETIEQIGGTKLGVSVMGVSNVEELDETMRVWRSILDGLENGEQTAVESGRGTGDHLWSLSRQKKVAKLARGIRQVLGKWVDYTWTSPPPGFVNQRKALTAASEQLLTPAASPPQVAFKGPDDTAEIESSNLI